MMPFLLTALGAPLALGQSESEPVEGFVRYVSLAVPDDVDPEATRSQLELELRGWGLSISNCDYLRAIDRTLDEEIEARYPTWRFDPDLSAEKRVLTAQCTPSEDSTVFYAAKVALAVDRDLGSQKRATVQLLPLGDGADEHPQYFGGYAHRPYVERVSWADVLARAIERAISGDDAPPTLGIRAPRSTLLDTLAIVDSRDAWDPDGDPFIVRWTATLVACRGTASNGTPIVVPKLKRCPRNHTSADAYEVPLDMGETSRERALDPPAIGEYTVQATATSQGQAVADDIVRRIVVRPAHPTFLGVDASLARLPGDFFAGGDPESLSAAIGAHVLRRAGTVIGPRYVTDVLVGASATVHVRDGDLLRSAPLVTVGFDALGRVYGPLGHWGIEFGGRIGIGAARAVDALGAFSPSHVRVGLYRQDRRVTYRLDDRPCRGLACANLGASVMSSFVIATRTNKFGISLGPHVHLSFNP